MMQIKNWLYPIGLYLLTALAIWADADWWILGLVGLLAVFWATGWGWACWLRRKDHSSFLPLIIDAAWISLVIGWLDLFILRELGLANIADSAWFVWGISFLWTIAGLWLSKDSHAIYPMSPREEKGLRAIVLAMLAIMIWKSDDIARPLDGHWYLEGAADPKHQLVPVRPANNWSEIQSIGWIDAGAFSMIPTSTNTSIIADQRANGRITLAVRGPVGSYIEAKGVRNTVASAMSESIEEGPVDRYLNKGVAAISIWADLQPDEQMPIKIQGEQAYLMASGDAVWSLHSTGDLRYTFYYQLLNQVENQNWAEEVRVDRRFTWNQPPGWSPILAISNILVVNDLNGAATLFLHVIALVALSTLRLATLIAPRAPNIAWNIPALLMMSHALLMLEPASHNFPDSLFAASLVAVWIALVEGNPIRFAIFGVLAQALRWPGAILSSIFVLLYRWKHILAIASYLQYLWMGILFGGLITLGAVLTGDAEDLLFILYFETFPEHWHDNYNFIELLQRIPRFFGKWMLYTGGTLLLSLPFLFNKYNHYLPPILWSVLGYGLLLATIDHDPSHYFLPLVALTGPSFIAAATCIPNPKHQQIIIWMGMLGIGCHLWLGIV